MENWDKVTKHDLRTRVLTNAGHDLRSGRDAGTARSPEPDAAGLSVVPEGGEGFGGGAALRGGA